MTPSKAQETDPACEMRRIRAQRIRMGLGIVATLLYLVVRMHTMITLHADLRHDDQLFTMLGERIASWRWLGAYDAHTLIKGPGYPLFLAANAWLGTPISLTEALFQAVAIGVFFWIFARISHMPNVATFGYIATIWMPAPYLDRIMRDSIYPAQMLLIVSGMLAIFFLDLPSRRRYAWALATGLVAGWFSLTREEGIWIVPGIAVLVIGAILHRRYKRQIASLVLTPLLVVIAGYGATQIAFACTNKVVYGSFVRVETVARPFAGALAALQSVQVGVQIPYVPVPRQAREAIYAVSPSFLQLKPVLDPPTGSPWQYGCQFYPQSCGDIAGGWFQWAIRDAVADRGYYRSPQTAADFYRQLTREIQAACRAGKLQCKPLPISMIPRISIAQWKQLPRSVLDGFASVTLRTSPLPDPSSSGTLADIASDVAFLGSPLRAPSHNDIQTYGIFGWYYGRNHHGWLSGKLASGDTMATWSINRIASPDLVSAFADPDGAQRRFNIVASCQPPCIFSFVDESGASVELNLAEQAGHTPSFSLNGATLNIDHIEQTPADESTTSTRSRFAAFWRTGMEKVYGHLLPWLLPLASIAVLVALLAAGFRRRVTPVLALASALWVLLVSRLVLLALVDISSFPAIIVPYLSPAYVLACITPIMSIAALYELLRSRLAEGPSVEKRAPMSHI